MPASPRRDARRTAAIVVVLASMVAPGCLTGWLWSDERVQVLLAHERTALVVDSIGVVPDVDEPADGARARLRLTAPALQVRAHGPDGANGASGIVADVAGDSIWLLEPRDAAAAAAIARLLTGEPFGPLGRCELEIDWTWSPRGEEFVSATVAIGGDLDGIGERVVDEATAARLLASAGALDRSQAATSELAAAVEAAERVDWRLLVPLASASGGTVLGAVAGHGAADGDRAMRLLVRVGTDPQCNVLLPAAVTPLLAAVRRDWSTLFPRYVLQARCFARRLPAPLPAIAVQQPLHPVALGFTRAIEGTERRHSLLERILLTPATALLDAAWWVLKHGPIGDLLAWLEQMARQHDRDESPRTPR